MDSYEPFSPGNKIIAYLRDSGHEEQELSLVQQEKEVRAWAVQNSLNIVRIYRDTAPGSSTSNRDQFITMMADLRAGLDVAGLVVWKFSRLSRNINDAQFYRADLRRRGYIVHSITDNIPAGPGGQLIEAVIDWSNQRHLEEMSIGVKRGLNHLVKEYGAVPGTPPVGMMREKVIISEHRDGKKREAHRWVPDPKVAPRIRLAYKMLIGGATNRQILEKTRLFKSVANLRYMFANQIYRGILVYSGETYEDYCEPIVDDRTWEAAQLVLEKRAEKIRQTRGGRDHPRRKGGPPNFILSGLLYCARCSTPMNVNQSKNWAAYVCGKAKRRQGCDAKALPKDTIEQAVLNTLRDYVLDPKILAAVQQANKQRQLSAHDELVNRIQTLKAELADLRHKIQNLIDAVAAAGHSEALLSALERAERQEAAIIEEINLTEGNLNARIPDFSPEKLQKISNIFQERLASGRPEEIKFILLGLVDRITVERVGKKRILGQILYHHPGEVELPGPKAFSGLR